MGRLVAWGAVVFALLGLIWWASPLVRESELVDPSSEGKEGVEAGLVYQPAPPGSADVVEGAEARAGDLVDPQGLVERRFEADGVVLSGTVSGEGLPLDGARVAWTALSPAFDEERFWWRAGDRELVESSTVVVRTVGGRFEFSEAPLGLVDESVLWVTCPGFRGECLDRDTDEEGADAPSFELRRAESVRIRVVDGEDRPLEGASVGLRGLTERVSSIGRRPEALRADRSRRALLLEWTSDADGSVTVPSVEGRLMLSAELDGARSPVFLGELEEGIVLRIGPTFSAGGRVSLAAGTEVSAPDVWVECMAARGYQVEHLARASLQDDLGYRMDAVPWVACDQLVFRLHGGLVSNREVTAPPPRPGGHVTLDFTDVPLGGIFRAKVIDEDESPIAGATVYTSAQIPGGDWHGRAATTDETGLAVIPGSGPGQVWVQAEASGYVGATDGAFEVEAGREYGAVVLTLTQASRVVGRCTFAGEPVRTFDVLFWTDTPRDHEIEAFRGQEDGRFELDKAPAGTLFLRAQAAGYATSETAVVEVPPGAAAEVELVLREPAVARGRVVDARSGEETPGATLVVHDRERRRTLRQLGPTVESGPDGSFELTSLNPGENGVLIEAPGYAKRFLLVHGDPGAPNDLGDVAIEREGVLRVSLAADGGTDFSGFAFSAVGDETTLDQRPFPADGVLEIADVAPGVWRLVVHHPSGSWIQRSGALAGGRDWEVVFDVSSDRRLHVVVEPDAQGRVPEGLLLVTSYHDGDDGDRNAALPVPPSGEVTWEGLPDQELYVSLRAPDGGSLDTRRVRWEGTDDLTVRLDPHADARTLRVVDADGTPISGVQVVTMAAGTPDRWSSGGNTDRDGRVRLGGLDFGRVVAVLSHPSHGTRLGVPVDLELDAELVLDVREDLRARLVDGSSPCPGVDVDVWDADSSFWVGRFSTDGEGLLRVDRLQGRVALDVRAAGTWATRATVDTQAGGSPAVVPVRRTGDLELLATTAGGAPLPAARLELRSRDLEESASAWAAAGRIAAPPELLTGADGRLRIRGLPRGPYDWLLEAPDGGVDSGTVDVPPGGVASVSARAGS